MKREIEFRGIMDETCYDDEPFVYGSLIHDIGGEVFYIQDINCQCHIDSKTIGQYTGLKDKNGVKIFDGDIDKTGLIIKWNQLHCCYGLFNKNGYVRDITADLYDDKGNTPKEYICSGIEVIGNVYKNKELLE